MSDKPNIQPMPGYILVEQIEEDDKVGGLTIAKEARDQPSKGRIVATGGQSAEEMIRLSQLVDAGVYPSLPEDPIRIGTIVYFTRWSGMELADAKYKLVKYDDIQAREL